MIAGRRVRTYLGPLLVGGIGGGLSLMHVGHALADGETIRTFLLGILLPLLSTLCVCGSGVLLWRRGTDSGAFRRIGVWSAVGTVFLSLGGVVIILYQQQHGVTMDEQVFVVANSASGGALVGLVVGIYDTRQRRAQRRVDRTNRQLTILNRILRHDIRNSANVIQGNAALLPEESVDTAARAERIRHRATDLVRLGDQAKQIERVLNEGPRSREVVDVASVVESSCERLRSDYPGATIDSAVESTRYVAAHRLVEVAVVNVIENGIEHNDAETPRVTIDAAAVVEDGTDYVEVRIADNGPGIPDNEVSVIERGYETELKHTSGLGLWLVSWIIETAGGTVRFEDNDPTGSVVRLRMKRAGRPKLSTTPGATDAATP